MSDPHDNAAPASLPTLAGLEAFEVAARHRSFSRAATELGVTQSAVSHRIKALETQLGCALFERRAREVDLTDAGRVLADPATQAFAALRAGVDRLRRGVGPHVVNLSCSPSFAIRWLVPRLPDLAARHPELRVRLDADDRLSVPGEAGIDACLRYGAGGYPGVAQTKLADERIFPVCSPTLGARLRDPADLATQRLFHDTVLRAHPGRIGWTRWLDAAGVLDRVDPEAGPRFSHAHLAIEAAIAGEGVALGRTTLVAADLAAGRLVRPFALELPSALAYWWLTAAADERPALTRFRAWLLDAARPD